MTLGLIGRKVGMTTVFDADGLTVPVTVVKLGENIVTAKRTREKDGYSAVQVGGFAVGEKQLNKPEHGVFKKSGLPSMKPLREFRVEESASYNVGEKLDPSAILKEGEMVDVRGRSIGKGFQGTVKRYHAGRGPMSHGSKFHRSMGSIGPGTTPGRVFKGLHMPGGMGNENVCARKLTVVRVDSEKGIVLVKGAIPGADQGLVYLTPSKKKWNP